MTSKCKNPLPVEKFDEFRLQSESLPARSSNCHGTVVLDANRAELDRSLMRSRVSSHGLGAVVRPLKNRLAGSAQNRHRIAASAKFKFIFCSIVLLALALGFNTLFTWSSLDKLFVNATIAKYRIIAKTLQEKIETTLPGVKTIPNLVGIEQLLDETKLRINRELTGEGIAIGHTRKFPIEPNVSVSVASPEGLILFSSDQTLVNSTLPMKIRVDYRRSVKPPANPSEHKPVLYNDHYLMTLPLRDIHGNWAATIFIFFGQKPIKEYLNIFHNQSTRSTLLVLAGGVSLLTLLLHLTLPSGIIGESYPKKKITLAIFLVICTAQILTSGLNTLYFKTHYLKISRDKAQIALETLGKNIEQLLPGSAGIDALSDMERLVKESISASTELKHICIFNKEAHPIYLASKTEIIDFQKAADEKLSHIQEMLSLFGNGIRVHRSIIGNDSVEGYIYAVLSKDILADELIELILDSVTVIVISILFFIELLILIFKLLEKQVSDDNRSKPVQYGIMRPAAFLFLFGIDMSVSFLPLHMGRLYEPLFGLSKDMVMGLPITVEFTFVGLAILMAGVWLDRRGWHEPFMGGLFLAGLGVLYSWLAPSAMHFIISRAFSGLGYGLALMASQGFVIAYSDSRSKARALAHLFAGIYAGSICGGAAGAMLAERIGYNAVFFIGAVILFSVIAYTLLFMRNAIKKPEDSTQKAVLSHAKSFQVYKFLSNRIVLSLIFFSSLPASIGVVGFLNYFSPIYLDSIGSSQSTIGRVLMIYGVSLVYIGPLISRYVDASNNKKNYIFFGCILGSLTFLTFHFLNGIIAAIVAVLLLGLSSSFVIAAQSAYVLKLKVTQELGEGKAIGIFRASSRVGQALGPIVFSSLMAASDVNLSISQFGLAYLLSALLFLLLTQREPKNNCIGEYAL